MTKSRWAAVTTVAVLAATVGLSTLYAQERHQGKRGAAPKQVTLAGTLVDLQYAMSGKFMGNNLEACSRDCILRGVPAALETDDGLIVIGMVEGSSAGLSEHAMKKVEATGMLFRKHGIKYLAVASIKSAMDIEPEALPEQPMMDDDSQYDSPDVAGDESDDSDGSYEPENL